MGQNRLICFLDLLGFKNYTKNDPSGALLLLENFQSILQDKQIDRRYSHNIPPKLQRLYNNNLITSFECFIPFSDSIFITSKDVDNFIFQVSSFIYNCYHLTSDQYKNPINPQDPCLLSNGDHWYPTFFRGGVDYGDVICFKADSITSNTISKTYNLTGIAVINAVGLEKSAKGPRLFCSPNILKQVTKAAHFVKPFKGAHEIMWPMSIFIDENPAESEIHKVDDIFIQASKLFKAYGFIPKIGVHYREFLTLVTQSTLQYFQYRNSLDLAKNHLLQLIKHENIMNMKRSLMK